MVLAIGQFGSGESSQPFKTVKDYDDWLKRVHAYTIWCDSAIGNFKQGMATNYVLPKTLVVKRYMARPAQALSYKIGALKIRELRDKLAKQQGDKFDIREFHKQVLNSGCLPLSVLEEKIIHQ